jgi:hypothetical protein
MSYGKWTLTALQVFAGTGYLHSWHNIHFYQPLEAKYRQVTISHTSVFPAGPRRTMFVHI